MSAGNIWILPPVVVWLWTFVHISIIQMSGGEPVNKKTKMANSLEQLKKLTTIVADSGDFEGKSYSSGSPRVIYRYISSSQTWAWLQIIAQGDLTWLGAK